MKKLLLTTIILICSANFASASPPDSCLWAPIVIPGLYHIFDDDNPDNSGKVLFFDTCAVSQYKVLFTDTIHFVLEPRYQDWYSLCNINKLVYSKSMWELNTSNFIFDTAGKPLNTMNYFTIDDIDISNTDVLNGLDGIKAKYGQIKFRFSKNRNESIQEAMNSVLYNKKITYVETENIVNSIDFAEDMCFVSGFQCFFRTSLSRPNSVFDIDNELTVICSDDMLNINSKSEIQTLSIFDSRGSLIIQTDYHTGSNAKINISMLQNGIYFLKVNENIQKFLVVR